MAEDLNSVVLVGRLTRDAELVYTRNDTPLLKFGLAVNRRRRDGEVWVDEGHFFDLNFWGGRRAEALHRYLKKGQQVAVNGQLRQDRWEQDGQRRSRVVIDVNNLQLLGSRADATGEDRNPGGHQASGRFTPPPARGDAPPASGRFTPPPTRGAPAPPSGDEQPIRDFEDDIPF